MADIKDRTYQGTETYGQAFDRMSKGQAGYAEAVGKLAQELANIHDLTDLEQQKLEDWLKTLGEIRDHWEDIGDFIEEELLNINTTKDSLDDIRKIFTSIVEDLQSTQRTSNERLKIAKNYRDLAGEVSRSLVVQNGLSESNLRSIEKRLQKTKEIYDFNVKQLTGGSLDPEDIRKAREGEQAKLDGLLMQQESLQNRVARLQRQLADGSGDIHTRDKLRQALTLQAKFNKEKQAEIALRQTNIELLSQETRKGADQIEAEFQKNKLAARKVRRETAGLGFAAKMAEKFGVAGAKEDYEDYIQDRVAGRGGKSGGELVAGWIRQGLTFSAIMGAVGLSIAGIVKAFKEVSSEIAKLQQNIGKFSYGIAAANTEFASSKQYLETANELVQQFGQNPISFIGEKEIARLAEAKNLLGLSAEQAGNIGIRAKLAGQNMDQYAESIVQGVNHGNALNRSAVAHGLAMKDVLSTSDDITLSLGNSGEALGRAIVAAKNLGMSLKDVDNIAGQLLNFESSIENEMKAQLLTGNQMNLARARGLALQNDLEGVAKELTKQGIDAAKFGTLNRIQQEAYASALGISREQLGRMLVTQAGIVKLTDEQVKAATGVTKQELEAMGISERWKVATDKLAQAFTPLLEVIVPIVTWIGKGVAFMAGLIGKLGTGGQLALILGGVLIGVLRRLAGTAVLAGTGLGRMFRVFNVGLWKAGKRMPKLFSSLGRGLGALGKGAAAGAVGIPAILGIAAGIALLGVAVLAAGKGIEFIGRGIKSITEGFVGLFKALVNVSFDKLLLIGPAFMAMGTGMLLALPGLVGAALTLGPITRQLTKLAAAQPAIQALAGSIVYLASAIGILKTNIGGLEVKNLKAIRKEAVKALNSLETGRIEAVANVRTSPVVQETIRSTAAEAENSKTEKLVGVIADRVSGILKVEVTNWDYDRLSRNLAVHSVADYK